MGAERSRWVRGRWLVARACLAGASPGSHFQPAPSHSPSFHGTLERGSILRTSGPQPPALWNTLACGSASVPSFIRPRAFEPRYRRIAPAAYSQSIGPSAARLGWVRSDRASHPVAFSNTEAPLRVKGPRPRYPGRGHPTVSNRSRSPVRAWRSPTSRNPQPSPLSDSAPSPAAGPDARKNRTG